MQDLVERTRKYARAAGRTGAGHYDVARTEEFLSRCLSWGSATLAAVAGAFVTAGWFSDNSALIGIVVLFAAALGAVNSGWNPEQHAAAHRVAGAEYGRLRRRADLLRLQLQAGDLSREQGLQELEAIGQAMSDLATTIRALSDRVYEASRKRFDSTHSEYASGHFSHAGGVVFRGEGATLEYLLVRARGDGREWVLPKGHIEAGESAEQAARREVLEETGVEAAILDELDTLEFSTPKEHVKVRFFLMKAVFSGVSAEDRECQWLDFDGAIDAIPFADTKRLLLQAQVRLRRGAKEPIETPAP